MKTAEQVNTKNELSVSRQVSLVLADTSGKPSVVLADTSGKPPAKFELLKVGAWRTPYHGDIMIMPQDLEEYIQHYKDGYGVSGAGKLKLPINYAHESWEKAAGWFVPAVEGDTLMATEVEWTPAAAQALKDGEWKCISAEFCPAGRGGWLDPLDEDHYIENVILGAALTNIPLMSQLEPVMASATFGKDASKGNVFLITASEHKENNMPTLEDVLAKDNESLTEEERQVLTDNKDALTDEQKVKFNFEVQKNDSKETDPPKEGEVSEKVEEKEAAEIAANVKKGTHVVIEASKLTDMQSQLTDLRLKDVKTRVQAHAARGAIKADQIDHWAELILANADMEKTLENLNDNPVMADAQGTDAGAADVAATEDKLNSMIVAKRAEQAKDGKAGSYAEVRASIIAEHPEFKALDNTEGTK